MGEERVRIVDIADELGLSTATVSNVIHGKTKKISNETVKRVQQLLEEKKYFPGVADMLLGQNSSKIIGVIINNHNKYEKRVLEDPFINSCIDYLYEVLEENGYFIMIKITKDCDDIVRFSSMWNMEGVVVIGFCEQDYNNLRNQIHIPFVVYDGYFQSIERYANISIDNFNGGYQAGEYFATVGLKKLLCISDNNICMDNDRYMGFCEAARKHGLQKPERLIIPMSKRERMDYYEMNIDKIRSFDGLFAVSDVYAIEIMLFIKKIGFSIPDDISVIGFDNIPLCEMVEPRLTTICQDGRLRAEMAIKLILDQKKNNKMCKNVIIPAKLIERDSAKVPKM